MIMTDIADTYPISLFVIRTAGFLEREKWSEAVVYRDVLTNIVDIDDGHQG
jgi:hypothetical protein